MSENKLYLVATPIGNLGDMSQRALEVLNSVDFVAAEDTRNTLKLFNKFDIKKPMVSYFEHNKRERGEYIVSRIEAGEDCALVTDAGTPAISDPGEDIVKLCAEKGVYGEGEKPRFYGGDMDYADPSLWSLVGKEKNIWKKSRTTHRHLFFTKHHTN